MPNDEDLSFKELTKKLCDIFVRETIFIGNRLEIGQSTTTFIIQLILKIIYSHYYFDSEINVIVFKQYIYKY